MNAKLREAAAHHEAAHALAAFGQGLRIKYVTILQSDIQPEDHRRIEELGGIELEGICVYEAPEWRGEISERARIFDEKQIIVTYAGPCGEAKFEGVEAFADWTDAVWFGGTDSSQAEALANRIGTFSCREGLVWTNAIQEAYLRYCWTVARDMVEEFWPTIQAIAAALLRKGTLNHAEVFEVIGSALTIFSERGK
jgi:hypothetical protein